MDLAVIIGGGLQGVEAAYLARKAGWRVRLIDRRPAPPGSGLVDEFIQVNLQTPRQMDRLVAGADLVWPTNENDLTLGILTRWAGEALIPLAFDPRAYAVTSSKSLSNKLFAQLGLNIPACGPQAPYPVIAKPDRGSGSHGVRIIREPVAAMNLPPEVVVQQFLCGPSYSVEVLSRDGVHLPLVITDLEMDPAYDCKRVLAPTSLSPDQTAELKDIVGRLAAALDLDGLMDLEVILHQGRFYCLEIDARLPSQTPTAVYWATGLNILAMWAGLILGRRDLAIADFTPKRAVIYEHVRVEPECLTVCGEHVMADAWPLTLRPDFFGADEALTDWAPNRSNWAATLIITGAVMAEARDRRAAIIQDLRRHYNLTHYDDSGPEQNP